jgi:hypothetical protein
MAIWQFKVELVPERIAAGRHVIPEQEWGEQLWWSNVQPSQDLLVGLSRLLPSLDSWSPDLSQWGRQDSDLVEVWRDAGRIESISARVDARHVNLHFIRELVELTARSHCRIVYARYRTVQPQSFASFLEAFLESPARKVVLDPQSWIPRLAKEVEDMQEER